MVLVSREQLLNGEIVELIINDNVVKHIGNFEGVSKPLAPPSSVGTESLISQVDLLAAPVRVLKQLTNF